MQFRGTAKCLESLNFIPSLVADRKTAIWCFVQLSFLSRSVKTIDWSPSCSHKATTMQPPEPSAIRMLWETAEDTWQQGFAQIVAVKHCGRL